MTEALVNFFICCAFLGVVAFDMGRTSGQWWARKNCYQRDWPVPPVKPPVMPWEAKLVVGPVLLLAWPLGVGLVGFTIWGMWLTAWAVIEWRDARKNILAQVDERYNEAVIDWLGSRAVLAWKERQIAEEKARLQVTAPPLLH